MNLRVGRRVRTVFWTAEVGGALRRLRRAVGEEERFSIRGEGLGEARLFLVGEGDGSRVGTWDLRRWGGLVLPVGAGEARLFLVGEGDGSRVGTRDLRVGRRVRTVFWTAEVGGALRRWGELVLPVGVGLPSIRGFLVFLLCITAVGECVLRFLLLNGAIWRPRAPPFPSPCPYPCPREYEARNAWCLLAARSTLPDASEGSKVGDSVGSEEGVCDGASVGVSLGLSVGESVGPSTGAAVGPLLMRSVGPSVGPRDEALLLSVG